MFTIRRMPQFDKWLDGLRDGMTKRRMVARLRKAQLGNLGDVAPVGEGVSECASTLGPAGACTTCNAASS